MIKYDEWCLPNILLRIQSETTKHTRGPTTPLLNNTKLGENCCYSNVNVISTAKPFLIIYESCSFKCQMIDHVSIRVLFGQNNRLRCYANSPQWFYLDSASFPKKVHLLKAPVLNHPIKRNESPRMKKYFKRK